MITRSLAENINKSFGNGKIIVVLGARQVGKTTMFEEIVKSNKKTLWMNCDDYDVRAELENRTTTELRRLIGENKVIVIDEAQRVKNIGLTLKIMADLKTKAQILVTGSSSLELANEIKEPATGRLDEYTMYPLSFSELANASSTREEHRLLEQRLIYGSYPEIVTHPNDCRKTLSSLANSYLYKDLLEYNGIKKPELLQKLVRALALQVGSEVSYNELSRLLSVNKETVETYIGLLEMCYVVFRLPSYSNNMRSEIKKGKKIYFYDNGIRNALISNFAPLELRNDKGALWENYIVSERVKQNACQQRNAQLYFWRTTEQQEIDLVEIYNGITTAYEIKWNRPKAALPPAFARYYPEARFQVVNQDNYTDFLQEQL